MKQTYKISGANVSEYMLKITKRYCKINLSKYKYLKLYFMKQETCFTCGVYDLTSTKSTTIEFLEIYP